jgi:arylsulfatase A-like enzyme
MRPLLSLALILAACSKEPSRATPPPAPSPPGDRPAPAQAPPRPRGPERQVFSLVDNRLLAHLERGGGIVALPGTAGFAKYMRFGRPKPGWKIKQKKDDRAVGVADLYAPLALPLTDEQARGPSALHARLFSAAARRVTPKVNGKDLPTLELAAGWQIMTAQIPAELLKTGENELQLAFSKGEAPAVEWIQLGGDKPGDAPLSIHDAGKRALALAEGTALVYYVHVPKDGRLVGDVLGDGCSVDVEARAHDGAPARGKLSGAGGAVELGALAGKVARLRLAPSGCKLAHLAGAGLVIPGAAPTVSKPKKPRHVVFWVMDSLRADRVKPYFAKARPDVPTFTALAGKATLFKNTYVQGNESRASHASIWSGVYPVNHRMISAGAKLDAAKWTTLGEAMKAAGFYTSGVSSNGYIIAKWGFGEGWDVYRNHIHDGGGVRGEDIVKYGVASVEKRVKDPWFLYLGTVDAHVSWRAKEPWFAKYDPKPYTGRFVKEASGLDVEKIATGKMKITDRDKERIIAIYDSNVSYSDDLLGKILGKLGEWGIADDTLVVVTADHGDEQWEDGRVGHGGSLRESLVRVPLLFYYPPLFPAGIVEEGAETIDILPTLMDVMGMKVAPEIQGESLIPLAQGLGGRGYPRPSIASQYETAHAMRLAGWKARVAGSGVPTVYHVDEDPYEKKDLAQARPLERRFLTDALSTFLIYQKDWKKARWGVASNMSAEMAGDVEK